MNFFTARITAEAPQQSRASQWHSATLEALHDALQAARDRIPGWHDGDDETAEQAHALDAAMEAAEELDIRLNNVGWLPTFKGALS